MKTTPRRITHCLMCRKKKVLYMSGHVLFGREKIDASFCSLHCYAKGLYLPEYKGKSGCFGPWQKWMGVERDPTFDD